MPILSRDRKIFLFLITIDVLLFVFFFKYYLINYLFRFINNLGLFLILNYLFGKYTYNQTNLAKTFLKLFLKIFLSSIVYFNIIFLIQILSKIFFIDSNYFEEFLTNYLLFIFISYLINIILIGLIFRNFNDSQIWLTIKADYLYKIKDEKINSKLFKSNQFMKIDQINNIDLIYKKNYAGIIVDENNLTDLDRGKLLKLKNEGILIINLIKWCEIYMKRIPVDLITDKYLLNNILYPKDKIIQFRIKRAGEFFFSIFLLFITFPILIFAGILIFLNDRGPIIYFQNRSGLNCKKIKVIKLRTMCINAEKEGIQWSKKDDLRITSIGKILRKFRIDEIPQLILVLKGEMSLIGPRPERQEIDEMLEKHIKGYKNRYNILPGLSGWAQVNYPYGASIYDSKSKFSFDLYYLKNYSIFLDFLILFKTIRLVSNAKGFAPIQK